MHLALENKRALVSGGTRGIGRAIVERLVAEGATVAFCSRDPAGVAAMATELTGRGAKVHGAAVDVADGAALRDWVGSATEAMGGVDILIPNVSAGRSPVADEAAWRANFEIDVMGAVRAVEAALPGLEAAGGGAIVLISSTAAVEAWRTPNSYSAMKAALLTYAKTVAHAYGPKNIRANCVTPGPVYADDGPWGAARRDNPALYAEALGRIPLGRMGTTQDIADAIVFLCSPVAGFITGANLMVDGGFTKRVNF